MTETATIRIEGPAGLEAVVGRTLGPGRWHPLTMSSVRAFAEATGDNQWIHLDEERARGEGPFGGPIAQGNLTLALADCLGNELLEWTGFDPILHRGWARVSYLAPVVIPAQVRVSTEVAEARRLAGGWWEVERQVMVESEQGGVACEARALTAMLAAEV